MADDEQDKKGEGVRPGSDRERNRLSARVGRYARVGANVGGVAAKVAGARLMGRAHDRASGASDLAAALGGLKGPIMKVAQLLATIPEALPAEYAEELSRLQSDAPPMGWAFVKRRMAAELGTGWQAKFADFGHHAAASASLGQVHKATAHDGRALACKLQYPDMQSAVEADLNQLEIIFALHRRMNPAVDTTEIAREIGARVREELDYDREARHIALYDKILAGNRLATAMFQAWWYPFSHYGVIHGDPHLGNYTVFEDGGEPAGINLLDYGCIRIFEPSFVEGVIDLYHGLREDDHDRIAHAYDVWGFRGLTKELRDILNVWAEFIYGPLLDDRVRTVADGVKPGAYGRKQAFQVHKALKEKGPVRIPQAFVFMDRAAIGLGGVFIHLQAELNYFQLFNEAIADFTVETIAARQTSGLEQVGLADLPRA